ncbi:hypothetical protein G9F71_008965 [Clostridium sp. FP2]|uniref:hypothetical protein n=1 Tax=Clostridium sp. FP2 TaxID=2724481 RepID=UPI0013E9238D|nr:hypothetical protein [Clostridium sp. FP2]MBZ9622985.1 hypothetical protein [Clostridium sp. FP2]
MAKISFQIEVDSSKIVSSMELEGQDLYYFNQRKEVGKANWIRSYLEGKMKISNIEEE